MVIIFCHNYGFREEKICSVLHKQTSKLKYQLSRRHWIPSNTNTKSWSPCRYWWGIEAISTRTIQSDHSAQQQETIQVIASTQENQRLNKNNKKHRKLKIAKMCFKALVIHDYLRFADISLMFQSRIRKYCFPKLGSSYHVKVKIYIKY